MISLYTGSLQEAVQDSVSPRATLSFQKHPDLTPTVRALAHQADSWPSESDRGPTISASRPSSLAFP